MKQEIKSFLSFCYMTALSVAGFVVLVAAFKSIEFVVRLI